jgi:integrase
MAAQKRQEQASDPTREVDRGKGRSKGSQGLSGGPAAAGTRALGSGSRSWSSSKPTKNVTQAIGQIYLDIKSDDGLLKALTNLIRTRRNNPQVNRRNQLAIPTQGAEVDWQGFEAALVSGLTEVLLRQKGVILQDSELELADKALKSAVLEVSKYGEAVEERGYLAGETELGAQLSRVAEEPKPITLWEVSKHKVERNRLSRQAEQAHEYAVRAWIKIIKKNTLDAINTQNLNTYLETLVTEGWNGKPLKADSANGMATVIASLIKHQSLRDGVERSKPLYRKIKNDKREAKLHQRDKAAKREDIKAALDYAYLHEKDRFRWLWLLLVSNTSLRVGESLSLKWKDLIELEGAWYFDLQFSKTAEGIRYVPLNTRLEKWLLPEQGDRNDYVINNSWQSCKSPRSGPGNWSKLPARKLKLTGRLNPHSFRHAAGGDLTYELPEGIKKKLMGHSGGITDRYTREDLKKLREASEHIGINWEPPLSKGAAHLF